ncbi:unnamed protein product [Eruca vesicaria subsp. sativa]|uniref:Uncharacterized protein n=1 Tax=Eruca vesicaria subsp. sativa TaxID=29727 RepID=A0ABC8KYB3_ERUVS|nr:unnamed protein product [Eruca vesicaria subsp. sativa]
MEPAQIDQKRIDSRFVEDVFYEHLRAPKYFDFLTPNHLDFVDDAWFCKLGINLLPHLCISLMLKHQDLLQRRIKGGGDMKTATRVTEREDTTGKIEVNETHHHHQPYSVHEMELKKERKPLLEKKGMVEELAKRKEKEGMVEEVVKRKEEKRMVEEFIT